MFLIKKIGEEIYNEILIGKVKAHEELKRAFEKFLQLPGISQGLLQN
jgi:hypothetical protein